MPFTAAHAVAAVPFRRTVLPLSALVVGCLSPDFEYFLRLAAQGSAGHTLVGLFWFDLPLSCAVLMLWHRYAARTVRTLAPGLFPIDDASILRQPMGSTLQQFALVCAAILIGAATHLIWDSFTHPTFWPYRHFLLLRRRVHVGPIGPLPLYKAFQHGSTVVGLVALTAMWFRWIHSKPRRSKPAVGWNGWLVVGAALFVAGLRVAIAWALSHQNSGESSILLSTFVVTSISSLWVMLVLFGALRTPAEQSC